MKAKRPISVGQMAKLAGFSRQRFYDLIEKGIFPEPLRSTSRPMYSPELQEVVLGVVETGVGANGEYVLFNAKRAKKDSATKQEAANDYQAIVESLVGLGLSVLHRC